MTLLEIDPNLVKPGWTPLLILIALAVVVTLLYFSMRRQFAKINLPGDQPAERTAAAQEEGPGEPDPVDPVQRDSGPVDPGPADPVDHLRSAPPTTRE